MRRLTVYKDQLWQLNEGVEDRNGIERLAKYEDFHERLLASQGEFVEALAKLRVEGKEKTVQYRELFTNKLNTSNVLRLLRLHGFNED